MIKKSIFMMGLSLAITMLASENLFGQLNVPAPSPTISVKQGFATSNIELSYSRPSVRGRVVFGDLVPY
ncbi:MAG: DUF2911 domain-containing protein, partial [Flavobacteriales bacterium]